LPEAEVAEPTIETRSGGDAEDLFHLYEEVFGQALTESSRRRWTWQYRENPSAAGEPAIWVARDEGRVLGQYASMPVRLRWGGREVRSSWGMDVFLKEAARGRGIGAQLFDTWRASVDVALGLGLTPSSYGLFRKMGYTDVGPVPFFVKVTDARAVARRRLGAKGARAAPVLGLGWRLRHPERPRRDDTLAVTAAASFGDGYDGLWERAGGAWTMCVRRDAAYLDWKYRRCPTREYSIDEARRGGALAGFAVSRHEDYRGLRIGWVVDCFAARDDDAARDALLLAALARFRKDGVARVQAFAMSAPLGRSLRRLGFRASPSPMQFCVSAQIPSEDVFADRGGWHVVFGDSDMDR
jgi:GNAT superfamily N-acetyltransferase